MKIVFMGTPDFAVPGLTKIFQSKHKILAVVTQPDKKRGRGRRISASPVKENALKLGLPVLQPVKVKEESFLRQIREISPDIIVVVAFGQILPLSLLNIPPKGCINLHGSLLPQYRGAAPIQRAIMNGAKITGVTTMILNSRMDAGDMLLKSDLAIGNKDTAGKLLYLLKNIGADLLLKTIDRIERGDIEPIPQDEDKATYASKIMKEECLIDWSHTATEIHNKIRGLSPLPGAYTFLNGKRLIMLATEFIDAVVDNPGEICGITKDGIKVSSKNGIVLVKRLRPEGKREMSAREFLAGNRIRPGMVLG